MPFSSRQQRWAFANKKRFAKRWANETPSFAALPEHKDAGTTAGAPLRGPGGIGGLGGLLGVRKRFKAMTRSEAASVAAHARWDKAPHTAKPAPKGRKPPKTDAERTQARQVAQGERATARQSKRTQQRADVLRSLNIAPDGQAALEALRKGEQPDAAALARGGFVKAGLVEQARDGSYRMTPAGRALLSSADAGDRGRAGDTISGGRDRVGARDVRQTAAAERKKPRQAGGGSKKKPTPPKQIVARPLTRAERRRKRKLAQLLARPRQTLAGKSFLVYKSHDGALRWLARTTTAYRDRDGEIITEKALDADAARMTATGMYGPLRYWHIGEPDPFDPVAPWGPGLDIGDCDYSIVIGRTSIESGTFKSAAIGEAFAESADDYELSPGFFHPPDQPNAAKEFDAIRRFERSAVPIEYGRASNLFTGLTVKEFRMDQATYDARVKAFTQDMNAKGVPPEVAAQTLAGMQQADKSAQQQGIAYKSAADQVSLVINGVAYKAETPEPAADPLPDVVINGVTYKALPPEFLDEQKDDAAEVEGAEAMGEYADDMGMDDAALIAAIADAVSAKIAPMFGDMKLSEFKTLMSGMATKDAGRATEIATLKAGIDTLTAKLAQLTGDQPAVTLPSEIEAAMKSAGPGAPPDPNAPQVPNDPARPFAAVAAQTFPQLYQPTPQGGWGGWAPQTQPPQS